MVANDLQGTIGHADLGLQHGQALLAQFLGDIRVGDRAEQATVYAGFLRQLDDSAVQLGALGLAFGQLGSGDFFKFSALDLEFLDGHCGGAACAARGDQEITSVTVFDFNDFTQIDPHWGTNAEFRTFVDCAHRLNMKVVLDIVMNHTGDVIGYNGSGKAAIPAGRQNAKNPAWLNKLTNYNNRGDVRDWNDKFWAQNGDFFGLDDIKTTNQEVIDGFAEVYSYWVNEYGVDGFRVDTAKHVDDAFLGKWWPMIVIHINIW